MELGLSGIINSIFEPIISPIVAASGLSTGGVVAVLGVALIYSLFYGLVFLKFVDLSTYRSTRKRMANLQTESKEAGKEGNQERQLKLTKESTGLSMQIFQLQMKPLLVSAIVAIVLWGWALSAFSLTIPVDNGTGMFTYNSFVEQPIEQELMVTDAGVSIPGGETAAEGDLLTLGGSSWVVNKYSDLELRLSLVLVKLPVSLPIAGVSLEAMGVYILSLFVFNTLFRKIYRL